MLGHSRKLYYRTGAVVAAALTVLSLSVTSAGASSAIVCPMTTDPSTCSSTGGNAEFGFLDTSGAAPLAPGTTVTAAQLQGFGVDLNTVGTYANGAQPTYGAGTRSTAADPIAEEDASNTTTGAVFGIGTDTRTTQGSAPASTSLSTSLSTSSSPSALTARISVNDILWHWGDKSNRLIIYRRGYYIAPNRGWGDAKIQGKHNMSYKTAWATTRYPQPGYPTGAGGSALEYRTPVYHVTCSGWWIFRKCKVVETVTSRAVVDFRKLSDGWAFGVVTNYAIGYVRAPDWVKNAINI